MTSRDQSMSVQLVDYMGDDDSVVNAARVSFDRLADEFSTEQNARLIRYLARHKHEIPFAHTAITLRVTAPISIRTQCFKHKIGFVENEISRRYVTDEPRYFLPDFRQKSPTAKQGSLSELHPDNDKLQATYSSHVNNAIDMYQAMIDDGVAPEQARFILPQGVMTTWIWTGSLLAFARFYNLRTDPHAQAEIRELAKIAGAIIEPLYPVSWQALTTDPTKQNREQTNEQGKSKTATKAKIKQDIQGVHANAARHWHNVIARIPRKLRIFR